MHECYREIHYDNSVGRFLEMDPDPGTLKAPNSMINKYAYVKNNPLSLIDPSGRFSIGGFVKFSIGSALTYVRSQLSMITNPGVESFLGRFIGDIATPLALALVAFEAAFYIGSKLIGKSSHWNPNTHRGRAISEGGYFSKNQSDSFSLGIVSFIDAGDDRSVISHETGHTKQYEKYGGGYFSFAGTVSIFETRASGNEGSSFECEASELSGSYSGYYDYCHQ